MISFDQAHVYQFVLFFGDSDPPPPGAIDELATVLNQRVGDETLGMKLGKPESGQSFTLQASGSFAPTSTLSWKSGSGVWQVTLTAARLDVHFDARGYQDVTEDFVSLERAARRVVPKLGLVAAKLAQSVNRVALIVAGQASCSRPDEPRPSRAVAATFFRRELIDADLTDCVARANHVCTWDLAEGRTPVRVNRNESGTANFAIRNGIEETNLVWQWDVNTSAVDETSFDAPTIADFFRRAEGWISERAGVLQALR